jgi:hypothetical protein
LKIQAWQRSPFFWFVDPIVLGVHRAAQRVGAEQGTAGCPSILPVSAVGQRKRQDAAFAIPVQVDHKGALWG